jgi:hypothetical protein
VATKFRENPVLGLTVISGDWHVHMDILVLYAFLHYKVGNSAKMHFIYCAVMGIHQRRNYGCQYIFCSNNNSCNSNLIKIPEF